MIISHLTDWSSPAAGHTNAKGMCEIFTLFNISFWNWHAADFYFCFVFSSSQHCYYN